MAEGEGFEPPGAWRPLRFSRVMGRCHRMPRRVVPNSAFSPAVSRRDVGCCLGPRPTGVRNGGTRFGVLTIGETRFDPVALLQSDGGQPEFSRPLRPSAPVCRQLVKWRLGRARPRASATPCCPQEVMNICLASAWTSSCGDEVHVISNTLENRPSGATRHRARPSRVACSVMSVTHRWSRSSRWNCRSLSARPRGKGPGGPRAAQDSLRASAPPTTRDRWRGPYGFTDRNRASHLAACSARWFATAEGREAIQPSLAGGRGKRYCSAPGSRETWCRKSRAAATPQPAIIMLAVARTSTSGRSGTHCARPGARPP